MKEKAKNSKPFQLRAFLKQVLVYGLLLLGAVVVLVPLLWMVSTSLKTQDQLFTGEVNFIPDPAQPDNYLQVWRSLSSIKPDMTFLRILGNTLFITALA